MNKKGFSTFAIVLLVMGVVLIIAGIVFWFVLKKSSESLFLVSGSAPVSQQSASHSNQSKSTTQPIADNWQEFISPNREFGASFPSIVLSGDSKLSIPNATILKYNLPKNSVIAMNYYASNQNGGTNFGAEKDGVSFIVNNITFPNGYNLTMPTQNENFSQLNYEMTNYLMLGYSPTATLVSSEVTKNEKSNTEIKFLIKNPVTNSAGAKMTYFLKGQAVFVGQKLYQIMIYYRDGNYNDSDYNKFINSFQLLSK